MNVLITGSSGFIARHIIKKLRALYPDSLNLVGVDIVPGTDTNFDMDCRDFFKENNTVYDMVFHCAAIVEGRNAIDNEPIRVATNLSIDADFFNWALRTGQKKLICFSSAAAYPIEVQNGDSTVMLTESMVDLKNFREADNTYGFAKLAVELLAEKVREAGIETFVFRPLSCYGEDQSEDYPFSSFIKRIKNRENPFVIWGDGEQIRDWIHHDDLINAIFAAIERGHYGPVNLCTGIGTSMNEITQMMFDISGFHPEVQHLLEKPVGVRVRVGDPTTMHRFYVPQISLKEGIRRCFQ